MEVNNFNLNQFSDFLEGLFSKTAHCAALREKAERDGQLLLLVAAFQLNASLRSLSARMKMKKGNARHLVAKVLVASQHRAGHCRITDQSRHSPLETIRGFLPCIKPIVSANPNLAGMVVGSGGNIRVLKTSNA